MNIKKLKYFFWDHGESEHFIQQEEAARRYKLLKYTLWITFPLTLFYSFLFFFNESYENAWIQLIDGLGFVGLLIFLLKTGKTNYWAQYYGWLSAISIYCTLYFTGGLYSIALPWIVTHSPTCILLAGKRNGLFWWLIDFLFIVALGILHTSGYSFPPPHAKFSSVLSNLLNSSLGLINFMFLLGMIFENGKTRALSELFKKNKLLNIETEKSEELLLNILPEHVAHELKETGKSDARHFANVTVLFTDFENFTGISEKMTPQEIVETLDMYFKSFDTITEKHQLEKIKTIGDSYMAVSGLPNYHKAHAYHAVSAALDILAAMESIKNERLALGLPYFDVRIGLNSGPVVAGIVGHKKFAYDIWGDTVNLASRMESHGEAGKINISESTYKLIADQFTFESRGKIKVKNKNEEEMYFVISTI